ncbi:MAG: 6-phosphogluconolactonase [Firmicutes bacterium]|jgi:glucosamine-6-phosphate deaminase|nr:6-phosphogluconolactonase [Bacillota bacterium]
MSKRPEGLVKDFRQDNLRVMVFRDRTTGGHAAAEMVAERMKATIAKKGRVNVAFAAAPSQNDFLASLVTMHGIDWPKVNCFHLDEYHTLRPGARQRFDVFLTEKLWSRVPVKNVWTLVPEAGMTVEQIISRYTRLLEENPLDIACIGIGENGHLAFNDPPVADFDDPLVIKEVEIDEVCRNQQVHDGAFAAIEDVPKTAITMTIPTLMSAGFVSTVVPTALKAKAVRECITGPISEACPASILRRHPDSVLILDPESASLLD